MSQALHFPYEHPPATGHALEVAPGIHWLRLPLPFALDHINVWLLEESDGWTLVDTGIGLAEMRDTWEATFGSVLEGRPIRRIVVTHYHPDHIGQAAWLARHFGAPVFITAGEIAAARLIQGLDDAEAGRRIADLYRLHGLDAERADALERRGNAYRKVVAELPEAVEIIADGDRLELGGRRWEVIVGRGHAPEHACLASEDGELLISGDQVLPRISSNVSVRPGAEGEDPLADYLESLERLRRVPETARVLPSHGRVFHGLHPRTRALARHHAVHLQALMEACATPKSAADVLGVLFDRELDGHAILFAMGESIAHLNHLHRRGDLRLLDGPIRRYVV